MTFPIQWIVILPNLSNEFLVSYNEFLCYLLYFPLSIFFTAVFAALCIVIAPFTYLSTVFGLMKLICESNDRCEALKVFL